RALRRPVADSYRGWSARPVREGRPRARRARSRGAEWREGRAAVARAPAWRALRPAPALDRGSRHPPTTAGLPLLRGALPCDLARRRGGTHVPAEGIARSATGGRRAG